MTKPDGFGRHPPGKALPVLAIQEDFLSVAPRAVTW
jgi:hypothetical protein